MWTTAELVIEVGTTAELVIEVRTTAKLVIVVRTTAELVIVVRATAELVILVRAAAEPSEQGHHRALILYIINNGTDKKLHETNQYFFVGDVFWAYTYIIQIYIHYKCDVHTYFSPSDKM